MLSRFSKLPGLASLLSNNSTIYAQKEIDKAISEIKVLGKRDVNNSDECLQDIQKILGLMKQFQHSIHIQRVSCHALSNLAMHVVAARWIIQKGGFKLIQKCIKKFTSDHKLCWLASSAVWNLARPPTNRSIIGEEGVKLMFTILTAHVNKEKVCNTAIGALSNLSLQDNLKNMIAKSENLDIILRALDEHLKMRCVSVMTSGAGLLANIAVNDDHASVLVDKNVLNVLMSLLTWNISSLSNNQNNQRNQNQDTDETLFRNTCAALNNLVTANGFLESFLLNLGIEKVFKFLKVYRENELYMNLLENCLINIDADSSMYTTSFHLSCYHGKMEIFKKLHSKYRFDFDLNSKDEHNMTVLDYAISQNRPEMVKLLCQCGAIDYSLKTKLNEKMENIINESTKQLENVKSTHQKAIIESLPHVPIDLCKYMLQFQHNIDLLEGMKLY